MSSERTHYYRAKENPSGWVVQRVERGPCGHCEQGEKAIPWCYPNIANSKEWQRQAALQIADALNEARDE